MMVARTHNVIAPQTADIALSYEQTCTLTLADAAPIRPDERSAKHSPPHLTTAASTMASSRTVPSRAPVPAVSAIVLDASPARSPTSGGRKPHWSCPFRCGRSYERSSVRSIRRHLTQCCTVNHPAARGLEWDEVRQMLDGWVEQGLIQPGMKWKKRKRPRTLNELSDTDCWQCPLHGCQKRYLRHSSRSIRRHLEICGLGQHSRQGVERYCERSRGSAALPAATALSPQPTLCLEMRELSTASSTASVESEVGRAVGPSGRGDNGEQEETEYEQPFVSYLTEAAVDTDFIDGWTADWLRFNSLTPSIPHPLSPTPLSYPCPMAVLPSPLPQLILPVADDEAVWHHSDLRAVLVEAGV